MFARSFILRVEQTGPRMAPGFSVVRVEDDLSKGFRARFVYSMAKKSVFLQFSNQVGARRALNAGPADGEDADDKGARTRTFSQPLVVAIPTNSALRILASLEAPTDAVDFASRQATGVFEPVDSEAYTFKMSGKANMAVEGGAPTEFNFVLEAGHAVILHRFLRQALAETMGFTRDDYNNKQGGNSQQRGGYNKGGNNNNRRRNNNANKQN